MPDFTGFPAATFDFLNGLKANNTREWFQDNRGDYDAYVLGPSLAFIAAMAEPLADIAPGYVAEPKLNGSFRRLNRDVRFSNDKTPYAPRIHMIFWSGDHPNKAPAFHLVLHSDSYGYGAGQWQWDPAMLERYRELVTDRDARIALEDALAQASAVGCQRDEPALKRPAGGVAADDPAAMHLRHKALVVRTLTNPALPAEIGSGDIVGHVTELAKAVSPVNLWLKDRL